MNLPKSISDSLELIGPLPSTPFSVDLVLADYSCRVESNSAPFIDGLKKYFKDFIHSVDKIDFNVVAIQENRPNVQLPFVEKEPSEAGKSLKEEFFNLEDGRVVRKVRTGMVFIFGSGINLALGDCEGLDNQVINFINNRFIEFKLKDGHHLFHASALKSVKRGLAICGFSGAGKSTLCLRMMDNGFDFVSNDRLLVRRGEKNGLVMFGVAKHPRINPGTIVHNEKLQCILSPEERSEYLAMDPAELWPLEKKYDALIDEVYGENKFVLNGDLDGLVILNWKRENEEATSISKVDLNDRPDLHGAFMKSAGLFTGPNDELDRSAASYLELMDGLTVFEVTGKVDFEYASSYFSEWLDHGN